MTTTTLPAKKTRFSAMTPVRYLAALVIVGVTVAPLLFVILGGFRTNAQINSDPAGFPSPWVFSNYANILASSSFWTFLGNSALISISSTVLAVGLGSMAAFAPARSLYARYGFTECAPFADYREDPNSTFMTLVL